LEELKLPLHISGLWKPVYGEDYLKTGSLGIGLVLEPLTKIYLKSSGDCDLRINDECIELSHIKIAREIYGFQDRIEVHQEIPLGAGAGLSANISIAIGYGVSRRYSQDFLTRIILAGLIGHELEVSQRTGLGDVISELTGYGIEIRKRPGPPCHGYLENIDIREDLLITTLVMPQKIFTPRMLDTYSSDLMRLFDKLYNYFINDASIERFFEVSKIFSREQGFLNKDLEERINSILSHRFRLGDVMGFYVKKSLIVIGHKEDLSFEINYLRNIIPIRRIMTLKISRKPLIPVYNNDIRIRDKCSEATNIYNRKPRPLRREGGQKKQNSSKPFHHHFTKSLYL